MGSNTKCFNLTWLLVSLSVPDMIYNNCLYYSTLNKITQFWLVESSTINPKLYSIGVPIKFPWKQHNFVECTINKKSHDLLVQFVNNRYSWFWKFSNCTRLQAHAILRTFKITRTYLSRIVLEVVQFPILITKSMRTLWLVNLLWVIVLVNPWKNCTSSELLYKSNRPQVSMGYKLINHLGCW